MEEKRFYWKKWLGAFLFGVALITVYKTFDNLGGIFAWLGSLVSLLMPFIIGFLLAFFLYPATVKLEKRLSAGKKAFFVRRKKSIAVLTVYFGFVALLLLAFSVILPRLSVSLADFLKKLPEYVVQIDTFTDNLTREGGLLERLYLDELMHSINLQQLMKDIFMQDVWSYVEGVKGVTDVLMDWLMGIVVCAYTLLERDSLFRIVRVIFGTFMKKETLQKGGEYISRISGIFYQFFFGKMIDSLIIGVLAIIGFSLLGVPYAALMGVIIMVFNMIPYFGPFIGAVPAVLVALLVEGIYPAIWTALFILALQQFDGLWLGPKILGNSVGVSPFWVIFAILIFGGWFGIWGMIFGVPVIAAIRMLADDYLDDGKLNLSVGKQTEKKDTEE